MVVQRWIVAASALAVGALTLLSAAGTSALWREGEKLNAGVVRSGELSLLNGGAGEQVADYAFTELTGTGLAPGGWSQAPLTIRNGGSAALVYRLATTSATDPTGLPTALRLRVQQVGVAAGCPSGVGAADPADPAVTLYAGPLLGATTAPARPLAVGAREVLCLRVGLAADAPSSTQSGSTAITFTFAAVST